MTCYPSKDKKFTNPPSMSKNTKFSTTLSQPSLQFQILRWDKPVDMVVTSLCTRL